MKILFMGTPDFAAGALEALFHAGHEIALVVTQPDKPKGRGGNVSISPVKEFALAKGLPVFQPSRIRDEKAVAELQKTDFDIGVVAAFGQILPKEVLDLPRMGCVNIHASLLPALRGAAPIQQAILEGLPETGITIMQMDEGCDTGDILLQKSIPIAKEDTGGSLFDKMSTLGASLITEALPLLQDGKLQPQKQDNAKATLAGKIEKSSGKLDFQKTAADLERMIRAYNPWPGSFTALRGKGLKVWKGEVQTVSEAFETGLITERRAFAPGETVYVTKDAFAVATGEELLVITEVQLEGKKRMGAGDFLRGNALEAGYVF